MRRRFLVPEVIQTSAMDCGPASLKALFAGFGIYLSYGRLREACQTDVDGTSIDTLESIARPLGLELEQRMMPADLLLLQTSACVPAIVVVSLPGGATHFVVLWRVHGRFVQVMDPAAGRIWMLRRAFLDSLYVHEQTVPAAQWKEWSCGAGFTAGLEHRMRTLKIEPALWSDRAHLDASLRLAHALVDGGALHRGAEVKEFLALCATVPAEIPNQYWTARPAAGDCVQIRGAVVVAACGANAEVCFEHLPPSLAAVRNEPPPRVWAAMWTAVRDNGRLLPAVVVLGLLAAAAGTVLEAFLFRSLFDLARHLTLSGQRAAAFGMAIAFICALLVNDWAVAVGMLRLGRQLELRLRTRLLLKIPRLGDRYFQSRLISDMAFRVHTLQLLRQLPEFVGQFVRLAATLVFTAAAIAWLYPGTVLPVVVAALISVGVPLVFQPPLVERELRFREISSSLSRFYLDGLLGSRAIKAHGAERTMRAAQRPQLAQWADAGLRQQALIVRAEAVQMALSLAAIVWLVYGQAGRAQTSASLLLLIYWALSIRSIGRQLASVVWNLPTLRNTSLRFLEPLGSLDEDLGAASSAPAPATHGVKLDLDEVTVIAGGHVIVDQVSLHISSGEHIAIVGASGAGKSSLVGLWLGWHRAATGHVLVDDAPFDANRLAQLRHDTAWIDPQVHLFNTTVFENLRYGNGDEINRVGTAIEDAGIVDVLQHLPDGLQTSLGEGGALVSGGEGQRMRIGRALGRPHIRLAILDEPARGLDRVERRRFLSQARQYFAGATLVAISHDVSDTLDFDRVLVIERGRIAEHGVPRTLAEQSGSRYRALLDEERLVRGRMWSHPMWRRVRMTDGRLTDAVEDREWMIA